MQEEEVGFIAMNSILCQFMSVWGEKIGSYSKNTGVVSSLFITLLLIFLRVTYARKSLETQKIVFFVSFIREKSARKYIFMPKLGLFLRGSSKLHIPKFLAL